MANAEAHGHGNQQSDERGHQRAVNHHQTTVLLLQGPNRHATKAQAIFMNGGPGANDQSEMMMPARIDKVRMAALRASNANTASAQGALTRRAGIGHGLSLLLLSSKRANRPYRRADGGHGRAPSSMKRLLRATSEINRKPPGRLSVDHQLLISSWPLPARQSKPAHCFADQNPLAGRQHVIPISGALVTRCGIKPSRRTSGSAATLQACSWRYTSG